LYEGEWLNDKAEGYGVYLHVDGSKYVGRWKQDKQNGYGNNKEEYYIDPNVGEETWGDGARYEGFYYDGNKHGKGKFVWADGSIFEGDFKNNVIEGIGILEEEL